MEKTMKKSVKEEINDAQILKVLDDFCDYVSRHPAPGLTFKKVVIPEQGHFEVLAHGWLGKHRIHTPLIHIEYEDQKIVVINNGTDIDLTEWLEERGVPREMIKPGHLPPSILEILDE